MLAQGQRMTGNVDGALREAEAAVRVFEKNRRPDRAAAASLFAAETRVAGAAHRRRPPLGRARTSRRRATGAGHRRACRSSCRSAPRSRTCAASTRSAAAYQAEIETLDAERAGGRGGGRRAAARSSSRCRIPSPRRSPRVYDTTEEHEVLANVFETLVATDAKGNLAGHLAERWAARGRGRDAAPPPAPGRRLLRRSARSTRAAVKAALERSIGLSRDVMPAAFTAIEGVDGVPRRRRRRTWPGSAPTRTSRSSSGSSIPCRSFRRC